MKRFGIGRSGWFVLSLVVVLAVTGCMSSDESDDIEDTAWELATLDGTAALEDVTATLEFASEGELVGSASCNNFFGTWESGDDNSLTLEPGGMTLMACAEPVNQQEQAYLAALSATASFELDGDELTLLDSDDNELATLTELEPADLTGTEWQATSYNNGQEAVVSVAEGTTITALFDEDGTLSGNAGCNQYGTEFEVDDDEITISDAVAMTLIACEQPVMDQESAYVQAIVLAATFDLGSDTLELRDADGALLASYKVAN